jgi:hypothetical protein
VQGRFAHALALRYDVNIESKTRALNMEDEGAQEKLV